MKAFERLPGRSEDRQKQEQSAGLPKPSGKRPHSLLNLPPKKMNQSRLTNVMAMGGGRGQSPQRSAGYSGNNNSTEEDENPVLTAVRSPPRHEREKQQLIHASRTSPQRGGGDGRTSPLRLMASSSPQQHNNNSTLMMSNISVHPYYEEGGISIEDLDELAPTVGDYCTTGVDPRVAVTEAEKKFPALVKHESSLRILPNQTTPISIKIATAIDSVVMPGALAFQVVKYDHTFFLNCPSINENGILTINPNTDLTPRTGTTSLEYRVVDHSNFVDDSLTEFVHTESEVLQIEVVPQPTVTKQLKDWKSFQNKKQAPKAEPPSHNKLSSLVSAVNDESNVQQQQQQGGGAGGVGGMPNEGMNKRNNKLQLPSPSLRMFRRAPPRVNPGLFAAKFLRDEPLLLLRCCNVAAERRLLSACDKPVSEMNNLLERVKDLMKNKAPMSQLLPAMDEACRLHFKAGSPQHLSTAQRTARLRAQAVGKSLGIDIASNELLDMTVALRLSSAKGGGGIQHLIRVLVEGGHLFKNTGELQEALNYYKFAFNLASVVNDANRSASMIPFLVATGDVYLMRGELTQALDSFEKARTFAETNGADTVVAECEDLVGLTYAMLGHHQESQNALARSLKIREAADVDLALAESLLFHAYCSALRESYNQAELLVERAIRILQAEPDPSSKLLLVVAQCIAGWLHLGRNSTSVEVRQRLEEAVKLCREATYEGSAELCIPLWLLQCHLDSGEPSLASYEEFSTVHRYASHHCTDANSFTSAIRMSAAMAAPSKEESLQSIEAGMSPILLNYDSTYGLLLTFYEIKTVLLLRWRCWNLVEESASRLQWIAHNGRQIDLLSTGISFRLAPIFAEAFIVVATLRKQQQQQQQPRVKTNTSTSTTAGSPTPESGGDMVPPTSPTVEATSISQRAEWDDLDSLMDNIILSHSKSLGEFNPKLVPLLLDVAELRFAHQKYEEALIIFGRALKIADTHNIIYLLGQSLFQPSVNLSPQELATRDRLAKERGAEGAVEGMLGLGTMLFQIAMTHEANNSFEQSISTFEKALAIFEMCHSLEHPCVVAVLTGLARVQLKTGQVGDAQSNLANAEDIIKTHHYDFGNYKNNFLTNELIEQHTATHHAAKSTMWLAHYLLVEHQETPFQGPPMFL